jgi:hypothetical protein
VTFLSEFIKINEAVQNFKCRKSISLHLRYTAAYMFLFKVPVLLVNSDLHLQGFNGANALIARYVTNRISSVCNLYTSLCLLHFGDH